MPVALRTERLVLSLPVDADAELIADYCADPLFERYMTTPWPYTLDHARGFLRHLVVPGWAQEKEFTWALRERVGGELMGVTGLRREDDGRWNLGYWLGGPHRGRGLTTEASAAVLDWATGRGLDRFRWEAVVGNAASAGVARRLGFRYDGIRPGRSSGSPAERSDSWLASLDAGTARAVQAGWPL